jgi:hypothetical protein
MAHIEDIRCWLCFMVLHIHQYQYLAAQQGGFHYHSVSSPQKMASDKQHTTS